MRRRLKLPGWLAAAALCGLALAPAPAAELEPLLARIKAVGKEGRGSAEAGKAWRALVQTGPDALLPTLAALDDADDVTANWLRTAVDAIAEHEVTAGHQLPAAKLEEFVKQTRHSGPARRLAYDLLVRVDRTTPDRLLPRLLDDPGAELRRDAVAVVLKEGDRLLEKGDRAGAAAAYGKALYAAREVDQVEQTIKQLETLGIHIDVTRQLGFLRKWLLIAPFDNGGEKGFGIAYAPEKKVAPDAVLEGKAGAKARWTEYTTSEPRGLVDLNKVLGKQKATVAYAFAAVVSPRERPVQVRFGCCNAVKVFLNGEQIFFREEYHHGQEVDQYTASGKLRAGRNELLLKVCQNDQTEAWAQNWMFQVRLCDDLGGAVPFTIEDSPQGHKGHEGHEGEKK
jgi:hypothetical protein